MGGLKGGTMLPSQRKGKVYQDQGSELLNSAVGLRISARLWKVLITCFATSVRKGSAYYCRSFLKCELFEGIFSSGKLPTVVILAMVLIQYVWQGYDKCSVYFVYSESV